MLYFMQIWSNCRDIRQTWREKRCEILMNNWRQWYFLQSYLDESGPLKLVKRIRKTWNHWQAVLLALRNTTECNNNTFRYEVWLGECLDEFNHRELNKIIIYNWQLVLKALDPKLSLFNFVFEWTILWNLTVFSVFKKRNKRKRRKTSVPCPSAIISSQIQIRGSQMHHRVD